MEQQHVCLYQVEYTQSHSVKKHSINSPFLNSNIATVKMYFIKETLVS